MLALRDLASNSIKIAAIVPEKVGPFPVDHDAPLDPAQRVDTDADRYTRLRVEFNGIRKDRVPAFLYVPKDPQKTHPAVLLQYGSGGNKKTNYIVALGEQFVKRGFVVLTIDVPLHGERKTNSASAITEVLADNSGRFPWYLGDYSRAMDYLVARPEVDKDRVGYAGISWGAITGLVFVAHEPRVKAMASIVGGGNWLGAIHAPLPEETRAQDRRIDPIYHVGLIAPRPLLLMNVTQDQLVPRFYSESLHAAAGDPPTTVKRWIETDHFFSDVNRYEVLDHVVGFMETGLASAGSKQ